MEVALMEKKIEIDDKESNNNYNNKCIDSSNINTCKDYNARRIVGTNMDLMKIILKYIPEPKDRKKIELSSKLFNFLSNEKCFYTPSYDFDILKNKDDLVIDYKKKLLLHFKGDKVVVWTCNNFKFVYNEDKDDIELIFKKYISKMRCLDISSPFLNDPRFMHGIDCFRNIKTVIFNANVDKAEFLNIFKKCYNLCPETIVFDNSFKSLLFHGRKNMLKENIFIPESVKNIHLTGNFKDMNWLLNTLKNFNISSFETLSIGESIKICDLDEGDMNDLLKIVPYFQNIIFTSLNLSANSNEELLDNVLLNYNIGTEIFIKCIKKGNTINNEINRTLSLPGISMGLRYLKIGKHKNALYSNALTRTDISLLKYDLIRMEKLTTLEIDLDLIHLCTDCVDIFNGTRKRLRNLKIDSCSKMTINHIKVLAKYCTKLENLYLNDFKFETMEIKNIILMFPNLKCLSIHYYNSSKGINILKSLLKKESKILEWFDLSMLCIKFNLSNASEKELLNDIEKFNSRKAGNLVFKNISNGDYLGTYMIIMQKSTKYYDLFQNIFPTKVKYMMTQMLNKASKFRGIFLINKPILVAPAFELQRTIGNAVAQYMYKSKVEENFSKEKLISGANKAIISSAYCIGNEKWDVYSNIATNEMITQLNNEMSNKSDEEKESLKRLLKVASDEKNISKTIIVSTLFTGDKIFSMDKKSKIDFHTAFVSYIRNPENPRNLYYCNIGISRKVSPLSKWKITGVNFFDNIYASESL
uniref:Leucine-rich repeat protein n=1 Tax=Parastrongyloides trichosuri TaxID=131310 RepID=A0A0N5A536_PARTI